MRPIDVVALIAAILAVFTFVSASGAFQRGRTGRGVLALLFGGALFLAGVAAGTVSVGTEGYRPLTADSVTLAATVVAEPLGSDSIRARLTFPDGLTHTFRVAGDRLRIGARFLRWKRGGPLVGRTAEYKLVRLTGASASASASADPPSFPISASTPVDLYELVLRFPALGSVLETDSGEVELSPGRDAEYRLEVTTTGITAERVRS